MTTSGRIHSVTVNDHVFLLEDQQYRVKNLLCGLQRSAQRNQLPWSPFRTFPETNLAATPCHLWGFGYGRSVYGKMPLPRTDISNSPWRFRHGCSSRLALKGRDGWVGFPDDGLLLRWQPRTGCFRGSQSVRTIAATASYPTLSRSCFAIPSCVTDCWSGAPTVPPSGPQSHAQGTHEPFNGTTRNDRLVAKPTNIQIVELLRAHFTLSATLAFDPPHRFRHHLTPDDTLYHFLFCAPNADTATLSGCANLLLENLHPDQSPTPADVVQAAGRLVTFIALIKRTFTKPALPQVYNQRSRDCSVFCAKLRCPIVKV